MGQSLFKGSQRAEETIPHAVVPPPSPLHTPTLSSPGEESKGGERNEPSNAATPSPLTEVVFAEEEILKFIAPCPQDIQPSQSSLFDGLEGKITVVLMPHKHTLFCERKV
jgi:hypothetical protein